MISDVWFEWNTAWMAPTKALTAFFMILNLIATTIELTTTHSTHDAATVAKMITRGQFSRPFWLGAILSATSCRWAYFSLAATLAFAPAGS